MAASMRNVCSFNVYFMFILNCMSSCFAPFPLMQPPDILNAAHSHCLVLVPEEVLIDASSQFISVLADVSFVNESKVLFGAIEKILFKWPNGALVKVSGEPSFEELQGSILLVKQLKKDRSCLLVPENTFTAPTVKHHKVFIEREFNNVHEGILDFINENCATFRTHDGSLNIAGLHRRDILENLYSPKRNTVTKVEHCFNLKEESPYKYDSFCEPLVSADSESIKPSSTHEHYLQNEHGSVSECEKIKVPSPSQFFHEFLSRSKPVIITGATEHWLAFTKWTHSFFKENYGNRKVHIKLTPDGQFEGVEAITLWESYKDLKIPSSVYEQLPHPDLVVVRPASTEILFSDFLDLIANVSSGATKNISAYLEYSSIADYFPELRDDISEMQFFENVLELKHLNIWLSDGNTLGKLHFDPFDNFLCQISGEKQVLLFEPHDNTHLYEAHIQEAELSYKTSEGVFYRRKLLESTSMVMSPVDPLKPDLQRFPKFTNVKPLNCTIKAGEVLFIPSFWWHEVQSRPNVTEHRNLAVNFWYEPFLTREFPCAECKLDVNPKYSHYL